MGRDSSWSGSYRQWEAAQRAQQRAKEQQRKVEERERAAGEARLCDEEAAAQTRAVEQRITELAQLLRSSLARDPRVSLDSLRRRVAVPPLDLGELAIPVPAPEWADFEPEPVRGLRRMFGGQQQYGAAVDAARHQFQQVWTP